MITILCFLERNIGNYSDHCHPEYILCTQEIGDIFETEENLEQAIVWYDKAADLFQSEEVTTSANQNRQKVAQYSAQLEQYAPFSSIYSF